jgi:hypothetical protein
MSKNKVRKTVSLNRTNVDDLKIIEKIEQPGFIFNEFAREAMLEKIQREENNKLKVVQKRTEGEGIKIIVG